MTLAKPENTIGGITRATLESARQQLEVLNEYVRDVLKKGQDYGQIPGTNTNPTLFKPGAANIIIAFNCHSEPHKDETVIDLDRKFVSVTAYVDVIHNDTGAVRARGYGECNSWEVKYRYRELKRTCPSCGAPAILQNKEEFGSGWFCWRKQGGCGKNFPVGTVGIEEQVTGRVENPDPLDQTNTYLKMAIKRAEVDAALRLPGVARFFTQDLEDMVAGQQVSEDIATVNETPAVATAPKRQRADQPTAATCPIHNIRMGLDAGKRRCHRLTDESFCYGVPSRPPASDSEADGSIVSAVGVPVVELPASDLEELKDYVMSYGTGWEEFERVVLKMTWDEWVKVGGGPKTAKERFDRLLAAGSR